MAWFAIQRISDGKLLLRQTQKGQAMVTWMSFDEGYCPHLYTHASTAEKAMKMWQKGGWKRGPKGKRVVAQTGRDVPVRVVEIEFAVKELTTEPEQEALQRNLMSVLD
jgi:hypothetical protein